MCDKEKSGWEEQVQIERIRAATRARKQYCTNISTCVYASKNLYAAETYLHKTCLCRQKKVVYYYELATANVQRAPEPFGHI